MDGGTPSPHRQQDHPQSSFISPVEPKTNVCNSTTQSLDSTSPHQNVSRESSGPKSDCRGSSTSPSGDAQLRDPISESYRSIVEVINRTSNGFKEGKKWKCVGSSSNHINHHQHYHRRKVMMTHSRTTDGGQFGRDSLSMNSSREDPVSKPGLGRAKAKRLVRQKATNLDDSEENLLQKQCSVDVVEERPRTNFLRVHREGIARQWTVDTCTGLKTPMQENLATSPLGMVGGSGGGGTAYLLRPVSRNSLMSASGLTSGDPDGSASSTQLQVRRLSPGDRPRSPAARSPMREKIKICSNNSSFNHSMDASISSQGAVSGGGGSRKSKTYEKTLTPGMLPQQRRLLRKQRTTESAPMSKSQPFGGSNRYLPRQHSNASAYSAVIPTSYSHQGITLVRGTSCSLVDIPTYLGPSVSGGVELAQLCDVTSAICKTVPMASPAAVAAAVEQRKPNRPRLQLDLTRKKNAKSQRKSLSRTVLCVSITMLTLSVTLVGTMLSVGSQYQDNVMAKQWASLSRNQSRGVFDAFTTEEPFVIVPNDMVPLNGVDFNGTSDTNSTRDGQYSPDYTEEEQNEIVPIIFPADLENSADLLDIVSQEQKAAILHDLDEDDIDDLAIP
ncbi:uncharacterized protein LOC131878474 [Tigriopus californicus]|uniref:uncharacterized protein LOC131878474 n=1 Tax=Tigriopus californicus TaxID=6832 RepID=UPI0027DA6B0D|nr:uncharacterized protein LOC131878474 [Tigriopus californicus]